MTTGTATSRAAGQQDLIGQTVVVLGGSSGIGLETARLARASGAEVVLVGRNGDRLQDAAREVDARETAALDMTDLGRLRQFFENAPGPLDHVMVTGPGPYYSPLKDMDLELAKRTITDRLLVQLVVARYASVRMRPPGTLLFMSGTAGETGMGLTLISALSAATPALVANLALELAPLRANVIAAGFVDTPLSARLLGDQLQARRAALRASLPVRRVVRPTDIAALAIHLMKNTAITGATYAIDGGQQLLTH